MRPSFNLAGPCLPGEHYMVPPERRLGPALELIDEGKYFTLTAGRQTGKTTSLRWLVAHYRETGTHAAIWVDLQLAREEPDPAVAFDAILRCLDWSVESHLPEVGIPEERASYLATPATALVLYLRDLARRCALPLVVLFDEADGLVGKAMVSFLSQLRAGYIARPEQPFPHSVALVGMRQVRDYGLAEQDRRVVSWLGTTSPFNVTADALTLPTFTRVDVEDLLAQHTAATGQRFEPDAIVRVFDLSQGHPWLVNALADHAVRREAPDRATPVTAAHIEAAKERIILDRRTHIDSLIAKLREPRVRRILDPMIAGERTRGDELDDDFAYAIGLGLLRRNNGTYEIANPIYREVIPRALTYVDQGQIQLPTAPFVRADGALDLPKLMAAWQDFWREDGHLAAEGFHYRESGPHLMLMAFLQRIINGGGRIEREYALGRGALDLIIEWKHTRHVIEVKVRRDSHTEERAIEQIVAYLDAAVANTGPHHSLDEVKKLVAAGDFIVMKGRALDRREPTGGDVVPLGDGQDAAVSERERQGAAGDVADWYPSLAHRRVCIVLASGTRAYRSVIAVADNGATQDLALNAAVSGAIDHVELLETCRLADDRVSIEWSGAQSFACEMSARVVQQ